MEIKVDTNKIDRAIKKAIRNKMARIFRASEELMKLNAEVLRDTFRDSAEFRDLSGRLVGEFGFTPEEVSNLDKILELMVPGNSNITVSKLNIGKTYSFILEWVDYDKLKKHPYAQHDLTRLDRDGSIIDITATVSWVEWLEEGESIIGYRFDPVGNRGFAKKQSRSGEGLMKKTTGGGAWVFEPTGILHRIAEMEDGKLLRRGFGLLARKVR